MWTFTTYVYIAGIGVDGRAKNGLSAFDEFKGQTVNNFQLGLINCHVRPPIQPHYPTMAEKVPPKSNSFLFSF